MTGPYDQTVKQSYNTPAVYSFSVTTSDATSTEVISETTIAMMGYTTIHEIHLRATGDKCFLGLGKDASTTHGMDIIPVWESTYFEKHGLKCSKLNVIRSGDTNVTIEGWVGVH